MGVRKVANSEGDLDGLVLAATEMIDAPKVSHVTRTMTTEGLFVIPRLRFDIALFCTTPGLPVYKI